MLSRSSLLNFFVISLLGLFLSSCSFFNGEHSESPQSVVIERNELSLEKKSDEEQAKLYVEMGARYLQMGKLDVALDKLEKALDLDNNNSQAHNAIAALYERIGDKNEAKDHYKEAISLDPDMSGAYNNYGRLLCNTGDENKGLEYLKKAINLPLNNRPWYALTNAGECELRRGNKLEAESYFLQALQVRPSFSPALKAMLEIKFEQQEFLPSRAYLERYLSYDRHTPRTLWIGIQTEKALGSEDKAEEYLNQLLSKFPASKEALQLRKQPH